MVMDKGEKNTKDQLRHVLMQGEYVREWEEASLSELLPPVIKKYTTCQLICFLGNVFYTKTFNLW